MKSSRRTKSKAEIGGVNAGQLEFPVQAAGTVLLCCGDPRSGRREALEQLFLEGWGRSLLITPSHAYAQDWRKRLATLSSTGGIWGRWVWSFGEFVSALLAAEGIHPHQLRPFERRLVVENALAAQMPFQLGALELQEPPQGLAQHLVRILNGLKQASIDPALFELRVSRQAPDAMDQLVGRVYAAYQDHLLEHRLYDVPGMYWEACLRFAEQPPRLLVATQQIIFDGFDDFTPSEFRLLKMLTQHVPRVVVGLNYDSRPERLDLYPLPARAAGQFREALPVEERSFPSPPPRAHSEYAAEYLLWRNIPPAKDLEQLRDNLRVTPCLDLLHEVECVGRQVKALLRDGCEKAQDIAIIFQRLADVAPVLEPVFQELQIPYQLHLQVPLAGTLVGNAVLRFLQAIAGWNRNDVLDALQSALLVPEGTSHASFPQLARTALVMGTRQEWLDNISALWHKAARKDGELPEEASAALPALEEALHRLCAAQDVLLPQASLHEHGRAFGRALQTLNMAQHLHQIAPELRPREDEALNQLLAMLDALGEGPAGMRAVDLADFLELLKELLAETPGPAAARQEGVQCMDASSARNRTFQYVFYGGLNEGIVPAPSAANAVYAERDLDRLRRAGVQLEGRNEHSARERLVFHHVLLAARGELRLSYRLSHNGREVLPSHLLLDLIELFPGAGIVDPFPRDTAHLPEAPQVGSWRDLRNLWFKSAREVPGELPGASRALLAIQVEAHRQSTEPWGHFDGVLTDPAALESLQEDFGAQHVFSVNQLEKYLTCPFSFFMSRILGVDAPDEPEQWFSPMARGNLLHDILCRFHRHFHKLPVHAIPAEEAEARMHTLAEEIFAKRGFSPQDASINRLELARARVLLTRYLVVQREAQESWLPAYFELEFGGGRVEGRDPHSQEAPFAYDTGEGQVLLRGRIDRIDLGEGGLRIVDYKSGALPGSGDIFNGRQIQLSLYAQALEQHLFHGERCREALYLSVGRDKTVDALKAKARPAIGSREENTKAAVARAVLGMRSGIFPPDPPGACYGCGESRACRYEQGRIARKAALVATGEEPDSNGEAE